MAESQDDPEVFWVDPSRRGILPLERFHISRILAPCNPVGRFEPRFDSDFAGTVAGCAERDETWINATIFELYLALHRMGHAHSQEIWQDEELVGGVYGVHTWRRVFRRKHVLAPHRCLKGRAGLSCGPSAAHRFHAVRHPVHHAASSTASAGKRLTEGTILTGWKGRCNAARRHQPRSARRKPPQDVIQRNTQTS